jgi:hypothetical protein
MPKTIEYTGTLTVIGCGHCHLNHAVPADFLKARQRDGATFWCPAGHTMSYGESTEHRLRRQLASASAQATHERDQRHAAERSARAYKGAATRIRNRVANGVCPCCNRTFADLARHMTGQHPDFAQDGDL